MFSDTQAVIDRTVASLGIGARSPAHSFSGNASRALGCFRRVPVLADELAPFTVGCLITAAGDENLILQPLSDDDVGQGIDEGYIGARA